MVAWESETLCLLECIGIIGPLCNVKISTRDIDFIQRRFPLIMFIHRELTKIHSRLSYLSRRLRLLLSFQMKLYSNAPCAILA